MNKQELVAKMMEKVNFESKAAADRFVNAFLGTIEEALVEGDKVQIIGFGTFETRERAAKNARNPKTGETIKVAAKVAPVFKPGKALKDAVNK